MGITGVQFYQTELRPVRRANANANLDRFQHNVILARRKPTLNMGEFRVAQPIAIYMAEKSASYIESLKKGLAI